MRLLRRVFIATRFCFFVCVSAQANFAAAPASVHIGTARAVSLENLPWEFYWRRFLTRADFAGSAPRPDLILQPLTIWNGLTVGSQKLQSFGYATYRLVVKTHMEGERLALRLPPPLTSYRVFIDGTLMSEGGKPGESPEHYEPRRKSGFIFFTPTTDTTEIIIHVANFLTYKGGLRGNMELGRAEQMQSYGMRYFAVDLFSIGLIFAIMLYHFLIFVLTRRYMPTLLFALLAFDYFLLAFLFGEQSIAVFFPEFPLSVHVRFSSFFTYVLPPLVLEFTGRLYPNTVPRRLINLFWLVGAVFAVLLLLPPVFFMRLNIYYYGVVALGAGLICLWGVSRAVREKRPGARILLMGLVLLIALTIYAVFLFTTNSVAGSFLSIGFTLFALFQSGSLAHSHAALDRENILMQGRLERSRAALENQRKQIEANLHDSLGGNLTDIKLGLEALEKQAAARNLQRDIRRLDHRVAGTIASLRTELLFLEDMQLAMKDFVSGINLILLRRYQMAKKPVDIQVAPETRELGKQLETSGVLGEEMRPELCMIVQELCNNSLKYTSGTAEWEIHATASSLRISVRGKSRLLKQKPGLGKETLRTRAEKIHAHFEESLERGFYRASVSLP